ncbi:nuclear transcription factor Y subunit B-6-like [Silene latifolia]|uniref:nuclear transcription factor Y subunit B-6-like n=1 Tax=Silene latifolia TaxID=37657 RepID=UPI003D781BEB
MNVGQSAEMKHLNNVNGNLLGHEMMNRHHHHHSNNNNGNGNNNNNQGATTEQDSNNNECTVREQDRFMPIANVIRIMRKILPPHAKISDDAKETIQECVSEYISFITGEANERCQREQRKTITAEDVLWAMSKLGFDDYIEPLTLYLHRYRELEGDRGSIRTCDPLLKMSRSGMDQYAAAYGPVFHIGPPGYYGGSSSSSMNEYLKESSTVGPTHQSTTTANAGNSVGNYAPYAQHK